MRKQSKREPIQSVRTRLREIMSESGNEYFVYSLTCPMDNKVRWIGFTRNLDRRFETHWYHEDWSNILKWGWILALKKIDKYPEIKLMKAFINKRDALHYETKMISRHKPTILNKNY